MDALPTLAKVSASLSSGTTTSSALTRRMLNRIASQDRHGGPSFVSVDPRSAMEMAEAADRRRNRGSALPPLAGIAISIKDLFDVAGETSRAGSLVLADAPRARKDAAAVARLRQAGAVLIGRTNMTEFAFSTLGLNPHLGTPTNPFDADRIPGGSSSGAATSVARGMAVAALGSDTAGSVRIPATFCGLAGFKPTQRRIPRDGMIPLSLSLDSIGPIAPTISCCAAIDAVLAGNEPMPSPDLSIAAMRLALPPGRFLYGMDAVVANAFDRALQGLSAAGAKLVAIDFADMLALDIAGALPSLIAAEALTWHRETGLDRSGYDARIADRLRIAEMQPDQPADGIRAARQVAAGGFVRAMRGIDALIMPTVPIVPPRFSEVSNDGDFYRLNALIRRNPGIVNLLDGCAATLPCSAPGELPVGLSVVGPGGTDQHVLSVARAIEKLLRL